MKPNKKLKKAKKQHDESLFKEFCMDSGQFDHCINVIVSPNSTRCATYVNGKFNVTHIGKDEFDCLGKVFTKRGLCPILWVPAIPTSPEEQATLAHELLHIVFEVTGWAGIKHSPESEEIFTHLLKYYYRQFFSLAKAKQ